jgi:hypothetical protein
MLKLSIKKESIIKIVIYYKFKKKVIKWILDKWNRENRKLGVRRTMNISKWYIIKYILEIST